MSERVIKFGYFELKESEYLILRSTLLDKCSCEIDAKDRLKIRSLIKTFDCTFFMDNKKSTKCAEEIK